MKRGISIGELGDENLYLFGFNGKENDAEISTQDYGMRIYNSMLGRFLSVDPLIRKYPELTPFQFASNTPIWGTDLDGKEIAYTNRGVAVYGPANETEWGQLYGSIDEVKKAGFQTVEGVSFNSDQHAAYETWLSNNPPSTPAGYLPNFSNVEVPAQPETSTTAAQGSFDTGPIQSGAVIVVENSKILKEAKLIKHIPNAGLLTDIYNGGNIAGDATTEIALTGSVNQETQKDAAVLLMDIVVSDFAVMAPPVGVPLAVFWYGGQLLQSGQSETHSTSYNPGAAPADALNVYVPTPIIYVKPKSFFDPPQN